MELAQAKDVKVVNSKREVVTEQFIKAMEEYKKKSGQQSVGTLMKI